MGGKSKGSQCLLVAGVWHASGAVMILNFKISYRSHKFMFGQTYRYWPDAQRAIVEVAEPSRHYQRYVIVSVSPIYILESKFDLDGSQDIWLTGYLPSCRTKNLPRVKNSTLKISIQVCNRSIGHFNKLNRFECEGN